MANTAQTVEREAPQAAEVKWQKPSNFKRFLKRAWDCKILLAMLLPALTYVIIFSYIPMTGIVLAFKKVQLCRWYLRKPVGRIRQL